MVSTFTPNLNLELQGTGDNAGTWGSVLNLAALTIVDQAMGGAQTLSLSSSNVTVTTNQSQNNAFILTGTLSANIDVTFPAIGRTVFIANNTTGNFTVTIKRTGGGTSAVIAGGRNGFFVLTGDGVTAQSLDVPTGMVAAFAMTSVPTGWLECAGQAVSRTTYAALFAVISTTFGSGDGSTTFNVPDLRGYFVRGWDHGQGVDPGRTFGSTQTSQNLAHNHTFSGNEMTPHTHPVPTGLSDPAGSVVKLASGSSGAPATGATSAGTPSGTISSSGGSESRPINLALMYCIKT